MAKQKKSYNKIKFKQGFAIHKSCFMEKETFASPWKNVANNWDKYYFPPGRPSKGDEKNYAEFIKQATRGKKGTALVLGATPEIRNVLHKFPLEVTSLDVNLEMILAMNEFVPKWRKDILVKGNWVENTLRDDYYDVVLADYSWSNIPAAHWPHFHETLRRVLKKDGYYIHRVEIIPDGYQKTSVQEILLRYSNLSTKVRHHFELMFELLTYGYNSKTNIVSMGKLWRDVSPFWRPGKSVKKLPVPGIARLLNDLYSFWGPQNKQWTIGTAVSLRRELSPYFSILKEVTAKDYLFSKATPMWFCKVKK